MYLLGAVAGFAIMARALLEDSDELRAASFAIGVAIAFGSIAAFERSREAREAQRAALQAQTLFERQTELLESIDSRLERIEAQREVEDD